MIAVDGMLHSESQLAVNDEVQNDKQTNKMQHAMADPSEVSAWSELLHKCDGEASI